MPVETPFAVLKEPSPKDKKVSPDKTPHYPSLWRKRLLSLISSFKHYFRYHLFQKKNSSWSSHPRPHLTRPSHALTSPIKHKGEKL
jgi:hypothetical protein